MGLQQHGRAEAKIQADREAKAAAAAAKAAAGGAAAGTKRKEPESSSAAPEPKKAEIDPEAESKAFVTADVNADSVWRFLRHHGLCSFTGEKAAKCPMGVTDETFEGADKHGKKFALAPAQIAQLINYGFIKEE